MFVVKLTQVDKFQLYKYFRINKKFASTIAKGFSEQEIFKFENKEEFDDFVDYLKNLRKVTFHVFCSFWYDIDETEIGRTVDEIEIDEQLLTEYKN